MNPERKEAIRSILPVMVVKDERFAQHLEYMPHIESYRRIQAAFSIFENETFSGRWLEIQPRLASMEELALVHTPDHIARISASAGKLLTSFDLDTHASAKSYDTARLAVGAVFSLIDEIQSGNAKRGFAFVRPPGHHAEPNKAMGFCLFNNVALGARYLHTRYGVERVMIIDIDAHHGNGTQAAFYETDAVLYVSVHQFPSYPGTGNVGETGSGNGEGYTVNIPLGKGCGDKDFSRILHFFISPLAQAYAPEILLISCGFDLYLHDRLCGMRVTAEGYGLMTYFLLEMAERVCNGRIIFVMEGGYNLRGIRECGLRVMQELCDIATPGRKQIQKIIQPNGSTLAMIKKVMAIQKAYWPHMF